MRIKFSKPTGYGALLALTIVLWGQIIPASASVFLEDQTWTELRDLIQQGKTTIIVPIGGTEQNGPAVALGKHNTRVKFLAEKIAEKLGDAIVAPVMSYVPEGGITPPTAHMKFPGTITITDKTFEQILESASRSFKLHGFKTIVFIGDHGSYQGDESNVASRLNREWATSATKVFAAREFYNLSQTTFAEKLIAKGYAKSEIGTHAGLLDTALMLAVDPSTVRTDRIASGPKMDSNDGVYGGDPKRATAAIGKIGVDLIVNGTVAAIRAFKAKQ